MLPITLDLKRIRVLLAGEGAAARRRLGLLDEADPGEIEIYAPDPEPGLAHAAGSRLRLRWPEAKDIARAQLSFWPLSLSRSPLASIASRTLRVCCSTSKTIARAATSTLPPSSGAVI